MNKNTAGLATIALSLAALLGLGSLFFSYNSAPSFVKKKKGFENYQNDEMLSHIHSDTVQRELDTILSFGSRFLGQPGLISLEQYIISQHESHKLDVSYIQNRAIAPVTITRQILVDSQPVPGLEIYPFWPNQWQPAVTPPEGISGKLVHITEDLIKSGRDFNNCIALLDTGLNNLGSNFINYASFGFKAFIIANSKGLGELDWANIIKEGSGNADVPLNYVRVAATRQIFDHIGKTVTLKVDTRYRELPSKTIVSRMKTKNELNEALVFIAASDAPSPLPDMAPGVLEAVPVATQLALLKGLAPYKEFLRRDIFFIHFGSSVSANYGLNDIYRSIGLGDSTVRSRVAIQIVNSINANKDTVNQLGQVLALYQQPGFLKDKSKTMSLIDGLENEAARFLEEQLRFMLNTFVFEASGPYKKLKISITKNNIKDVTHPELKAYYKAKSYYEKCLSASSYPLGKLLTDKADFLEEFSLRSRLKLRLQELQAFHNQQALFLEQKLNINQQFQGYSKIIFASSGLLPASQPGIKSAVSIFLGDISDENERQDLPEFTNVLLASLFRAQMGDEVDINIALGVRGFSRSLVLPRLGRYIFPNMGIAYPQMSFVNIDRADVYNDLSLPVEKPYMRNMASMARGLRVLGVNALSLAFGNGEFRSPNMSNTTGKDYSGTVYVGEVGLSVIPSYPVVGALTGCQNKTDKSGVYYSSNRAVTRLSYPLQFTDLYGRYQYLSSPVSWVPGSDAYYTPYAVIYDTAGIIRFVKDDGLKAQRLFKSLDIDKNQGNVVGVNLVLFRGEPVTILDLINPQTLKDYTTAEFIQVKGLQSYENQNFIKVDGAVTAYLQPEIPFIVKFKSGSVDNELVQAVRAVMFGPVSEKARQAQRSFLKGDGYWPEDNNLMLNIPFEIATSMAQLNRKRFDLQDKYQMIDKQTAAFQIKSEDIIKTAREGVDRPYKKNLLDARNSVTYATLNHPILQDNISEAIVGILWYLALLVPFVFFFEKLVFGFPDIRKQLIAQALIFLTVFGLLAFLHPAFQMIRSSLMILLGFVIFMISIAITFIFSGKFQENLEELRKKQGKVTAADVDKFGVMGTAFLLGLNNMHRRKVRTGLTCGTLVLITVVMICFTSLTSNLVEKKVAIGKAEYQGFLVKPEKFLSIKPSENFALLSKYGDFYDIALRLMAIGPFDYFQRVTEVPQIGISCKINGSTRRVIFESVLQFSYTEPLQHKIKFLTNPVWFTKEQDKATSGDFPIIIPGNMANTLGITVQQVNEGGAKAKVNGFWCDVIGIFDADAFGYITDLDGMDILPFNSGALTSIELKGAEVIADKDAVRISPSSLILTCSRSLTSWNIKSANIATGVQLRPVSMAVILKDLNYREAKEVIEQYMEQTGVETYYGLDGVAYLGQIARERSMEGLLDMLIPLIIAALTVLNTMKGSVYERKDEIYVYNAVGIAPKYVAAMFFAEAFVYSVVGAVLGYIISQGMGRILMALDLTGGLQMTFTSMMTIYASLVIMAAVFISTYFPAKTAMEIAAPADDSGWEMPDPEDDQVVFNLPFTFNLRDRIAILAFFNRYFLDHGEGSAGRFFSGIPLTGVSDKLDPLDGDNYIPQIKVTIWLKPYDLGVSQEVIISLGLDEKTNEFIANVSFRRTSGALESWTRLNKDFVAMVRQHFLFWRAVSEAEREEMYEEAKELLSSHLQLTNMETDNG